MPPGFVSAPVNGCKLPDVPTNRAPNRTTAVAATGRNFAAVTPLRLRFLDRFAPVGFDTARRLTNFISSVQNY